MNSFPIRITPDTLARELAETNEQTLELMQTLSELQDEDIQYGVSAKHAVYSEDKLVLYHFEPHVKRPFKIPVLISYALVNRPYMTDLQDNRSLVKNLLDLGLDLYLIDWGYPGREDRWLTLDDYINGYIDTCVDVVRERHGLDQINLLGICQGGVFSLCYASIHPEKIKNLITMVTPVDFSSDDVILNVWTGCHFGAPAVDADLMVEAMGNVSGDFMNFGYMMLKPFQLNVQKYANLRQIGDNKRRVQDFLRMEKWIFDSPDQAGEAWKEFVKEFYQSNKLIKGETVIGDQAVDLKNITMPVLNIYAEQDHMVPPASSQALEKYVGTDDYTVASFPVGHIGMYVSGKVQHDLPPLIANWLEERA